MSIGGSAMKTVLAGVIAAAAFAALAGAAQAADVCQWTGQDWACGDGKLFTHHYPASTGPQTVIVARPTVTPTGPSAHEFDAPRPQ
jgi:hypothetical protein